MIADMSNLDSHIFELIAQTSDNMYIYIADLERDYSHWSRASVEYFGLPGEYIEDTAAVWVNYIHPDDRHIFLEDMGNIFKGSSNRHNCEYRARNNEGKYVWVRCHGVVERGDDGSPGLFVGTMMNLGQNAKFDSVTGLFSYDEFKKQFTGFLDTKREGTVLLFDLDNFRRINDLLGYMTGDKVLRGLAEYCQSLPGTTFYRKEGDKFICLLTKNNEEESKWIFDKVEEITEKLPEEIGVECKLSVSCGVTFFPKDGDNMDTVCANAEYALEEAKKRGWGNLAYYSGTAHQKTVSSYRLQERLRNAISNDFQGFSMYYQPLIFGAKEKEEIYGAEALMRFVLPDGTVVSPGKFIPILEEDGTISKVGEWALHTSLKQAAVWRQTIPDFCVSVNVSYIQMLQQEFRGMVENALKEAGLPPESLILELTESCKVLDPKRLQEDFAYLSRKKIKMALDDFGTGYSSIALLRELTPSWIKIDHTFVKSIRESSMDQAILEYIMNLSRQAGIHVCVEGVENQGIRDFVQVFHPELMQGYFYSRPCPAEEFAQKYILQKEKE